jgi:transposase
MDEAAYLDFIIEIIRRSDDRKGFQVLSRRWVVERTFGWMVRWRRQVRDYEQRIDVSHAMILVAMGGVKIARIAGNSMLTPGSERRKLPER